MPAERDLDAMLAGLEPELDPTTWVFAHVRRGDPVPDVACFARIEEAEGTTLVVQQADAERLALVHEFPCRRIGLRLVSDLEAVGLTAAMATALTAEGIPANVIAGYLHDHVLVPVDRADDALAVLRGLAGR